MDAFKALEELSKLGKMESEIKVGEVTITLGTLDTEQESDVFVQCSELTGNAYFYKLKLETVKYALRAVGGARVDDYIKIEKDEERQKMKKEALERISGILKTWDENVLSFLYNEWAKLAKKSEDELKSKGIGSVE